MAIEPLTSMPLAVAARVGSRSFSYSEQCVELTSDFSRIFGNEYDTIAPKILSALPRHAPCAMGHALVT